MYIKKIELSGFRSFRSGVVDALSPGMNLIVGPNGSGKSTVVSALEFVLTRNNVRLTAPVRQSFICNVAKGGSNARDTQASVTVTLNNEDGRFPLVEKEVIIRRTVNATSDQYYVNGRLTKVDQFLALMETSGFSPNNSHFLIQQGFVKEVAFGSPVGMLNILRGISGAETFEERKAKAFSLIDECERTIDRLDGQIAFLHSQMRLFRIDRSVVRQFQEQMKLRRFLTGRLAQLDGEKVLAEIDRAKEEQRRLKGQLENGQAEQEELIDALKTNEEAFKEAKMDVVAVKAKQQLLEELLNKNRDLIAELDETLVGMAELSADINELPQKQNARRKKLDELGVLKTYLEKADMEIFKLETEIAQREADNKRMIMLEQVINEGNKNGRRNELVNRILAQLRVEKERQNVFLTEQKRKLEEMEQLVSSQESSPENLENEIKALMGKVYSFKCEKNKKELERQKKTGEISALQRELLATEGNLKQLATKLNVYSGNGAAVASRKVMHSLISWCQEKLRQMDEEDMIEDEDEVRADLQLIIDGYYGQFAIDCVTLDQELDADERATVYHVIEALLGGKIFQHVVANDQVAQTILHYLDQFKRNGNPIDCTISFLCLDMAAKEMAKKREEGFAEFDANDTNVKPLINYFHLKNEETEPAVEYLCRRLYVVRSFKLATELHQRHRGCDFVTLSGEKVARTGVISFTPERRATKMQLAEQYAATSQRLMIGARRLKDLESEYEALCCEVTKFSQEGVLAEAKISQIREKLKELDQYRNHAAREDRKRQLQADIATAEEQMKALEEEITFWSRELAEPSDARAIEAQTLSQATEVSDKKRQLAKKKSNRVKLLERRQTLTTEISQLGREINGLLVEKIKMDSWSGGRERLAQEKSEYEEEERRCQKEHADILRKLNELRERIAALREEREVMKEQLLAMQRTVAEATQRIELLTDQLKELEEKASSLQFQAENLGAVGGVRIEFARYAKSSHAQLSRALHQANSQLNRFSSGHRLSEEVVSRFDQIVERMDELEGLRRRSGDNVIAIAQIVETIEQHKVEIIDRTYKQVNRYLQEIFGNLVPRGTIRLRFKVKPGMEGPPPAAGSSAPGGRGGSGSSGGPTFRSGERPSQEQGSRSHQQGSSGLNESASQSSSLTTQSSSLDMARKLLVSMPLDTADRYEGMEILVSFTGGEPQASVDSLSGGQKTLVSLAFIFALQKVDPTPFYIFDEVDANLDEHRREDFANLVKRVAEREGRQFILTSFYPQTVERGDQFYRVINRNRLSQIEPVDKAMALAFILSGTAAPTTPPTTPAGTSAAHITADNSEHFTSSVHHITGGETDREGAVPSTVAGQASPVIGEPMDEDGEEDEEEVTAVTEGEENVDDAAMDEAMDEEMEDEMSPEI